MFLFFGQVLHVALVFRNVSRHPMHLCNQVAKDLLVLLICQPPGMFCNTLLSSPSSPPSFSLPAFLSSILFLSPSSFLLLPHLSSLLLLPLPSSSYLLPKQLFKRLSILVTQRSVTQQSQGLLLHSIFSSSPPRHSSLSEQAVLCMDSIQSAHKSMSPFNYFTDSISFACCSSSSSLSQTQSLSSLPSHP